MERNVTAIIYLKMCQNEIKTRNYYYFLKGKKNTSTLFISNNSTILLRSIKTCVFKKIKHIKYKQFILKNKTYNWNV